MQKAEPRLGAKGRKQSAKSETHLQRHPHTGKVPLSLLVRSKRAPRCLHDLDLPLQLQGCFTTGRVVLSSLAQQPTFPVKVPGSGRV